MRSHRLSLLLLSTSLSLSMGTYALADQSQVIQFNNNGVKALNASNFKEAVEQFVQALKLDPTYKLARQNLSIAYNNYGLQLRNQPKEALKQFHKAAFIDPTNSTTLSNISGIIQMLGKNPNSFEDRVALGTDARRGGDIEGGIVEFDAALKIKEDPKIREALGDCYRIKGESEKAVDCYQKAAQSQDTASLEVKLGQAYQAKGDLPNAIGCFGKAIQFKSDDPDVQDALVTGWEAALRQNPLAPENHIGLAQAFIFRGDFGQAKEELMQAIRISPGRRNATAERLISSLAQQQAAFNVNKHINAGTDLYSRKLYGPALEEFKTAEGLDPRNADAVADEGTCYQAMQDYDNALKKYAEALTLDPKNPIANQGMKTAQGEKADKDLAEAAKGGSDAFARGNYDQAIQKYMQVLKLNPQDAATHYNLGAAYQAKKDFDDAIPEYKQAISIDPTNQTYTKGLDDALEAKAKPIIDAAVAKHQAKDYAGAIALYQQAVQITPKNSGLVYNLASAQYSMQDYGGARASYEKAIQLDPKGQVDDIYFLATIDENNRNGQRALSEYQKYLQTVGDKGRYSAVAKDRVHVLAANPSDTQAIKSEAELASLKEADDSFTQAVKLQGQKQYDQAIALYQKALQIQPKNPDYNFDIGTCYQGKGDLESAIKYYQTAVGLAPNNKDYSAQLARSLDDRASAITDQAVQKQTSGDLDGAIALYQQSIASLPNNSAESARIWTNLGTAYQQQDKYDKARDAYAQGYKLDAKNEVGDLYLMGTIDENYGRGPQALSEYKDYLSKSGASGTYVKDAKDRVGYLSANPQNVQKLLTRADSANLAAAQDFFDKAVKAQQGTKYDDALDLYNQAVQKMPNQDSFYYGRGTCYQSKGDMQSAVTDYQKAHDLAPGNKDYITALKQAQGAIVGGVMDDAIKKQTSGDLKGAIEVYTKGLQLDPKNGQGWINLGSAYQANDDFQGARSAYQKAGDLGVADGWFYTGALDETLNNGRGAVEDYRKYLKLSPKGSNAGAATQRISVLSADPSKVQKIATQAQVKTSGEAQAAYDEAVKLQTANKFDEAIESYKKAIQAQPDNASFYYGLGTDYQAKSDMDHAVEMYTKAVQLAPSEPTYKQTLDQAKQAVGIAKAQPLIDSAIKKQTAAKPDLPGAIADYEAALKLCDEPGTWVNLGTAYQAAGRLNDAQRAYERGRQLDPKNVDVNYYLGTLYEGLKRIPNAIQSYRAYLRMAPSGPNAAECKNRLKILAGGR